MTRFLLVYVYPRALEACMLIGVASALWQAKAFRRDLASAGATRRGLLALLALSVAALWLRLYGVPHRHRVFFDALEHLHLAQNVATLGAYASSLVRGPEYNVLGSTPLWPGGWHVLLAQAFRVFGPNEAAAYGLAAACGALCVPAVYALALLVLGSQVAALAAAAVLAFSPLCLRFSTSTDLSAFSLLTCLACLSAFFHYRRLRDNAALALLIAMALCAANCRPENGLLAVLTLAAAAKFSRGRRRAALAAAGAATVLAPAALMLLSRDLTARVIGLDQVRIVTWLDNWWANLLWLMDPRQEAAPLVALAVLGALTCAPARRRDAALLAGAAFAMLAAVSMSAVGRFEWSHYPHAPERYALAVYPALAVLAGAGAAALARRPVVAVGALAGLLLAWKPAYARVDEFDPEDQRRYDALLAAEPFLPKDLYVISHSPAVSFLLRRPSVSVEFWRGERASFDAAMAAQGRSGQPVVLFKDLWWNLPWKDSQRWVTELRRAYVFEELWPKTGPDPEYALYLLTPRGDKPPLLVESGQ